MCDAAGLKSSLRTSHRSGTWDGASKSLPAALWRLLGRHVNSGRVRVGPDRDARMAEDVLHIRHHPLVPNDIPIYGYIYDVKSGKLVEVSEATTVGKAS